MARITETMYYDPRFDRAQTVEGAKARYISDNFPEYDEDMLEADLDRLLECGTYLDATVKESFTREHFMKRVDGH